MAHRLRKEESKNSDPGRCAGKRVARRTHLEYNAESVGNQRKHSALSAAPLQDLLPTLWKSSQSTTLCLRGSRKQAFALQPPLPRKRRANFHMLARRNPDLQWRNRSRRQDTKSRHKVTTQRSISPLAKAWGFLGAAVLTANHDFKQPRMGRRIVRRRQRVPAGPAL